MKKIHLIVFAFVLSFITMRSHAQQSDTTSSGKYDYAILTNKEFGTRKPKIMVTYSDGHSVDYGILKHIDRASYFGTDPAVTIKVIQCMDADGYELVSSMLDNYGMSYIEYVFRKPKEVK